MRFFDLCVRERSARNDEEVNNRSDESGQTTAEYALIVVVAAVVGGLVLAWASRTHAIGKLFDTTIGRVVELVSG